MAHWRSRITAFFRDPQRLEALLDVFVHPPGRAEEDAVVANQDSERAKVTGALGQRAPLGEDPLAFRLRSPAPPADPKDLTARRNAQSGDLRRLHQTSCKPADRFPV